MAIIAAIRAGNAPVAAEESRQHVRLAGEAFAQYFARRRAAG